jgi:hypothetical protein
MKTPKQEGKLYNATAYLQGSVENSTDPKSWRNIISQQLRKLHIIPWDPLKKPKWYPNITAETQRSWKKGIREQYYSKTLLQESKEIWQQNESLRKFCLHMVSNANIIIFKIDKTFTVGSWEELSTCKYKPVFIITEDPAISTWLIAQLELEPQEIQEYIHKDIDSLINYLGKINRGATIPSNCLKWMFMTYTSSDTSGKYAINSLSKNSSARGPKYSCS